MQAFLYIHNLKMCACVFVCVCVCERVRNNERTNERDYGEEGGGVTC